MVPRMSDEDLRRFVLGYCDGQIFTNRQIKKPRDVLAVFLPLVLWKDPSLDGIGLLWEWLSQAGPRSVNGYPQFMSVRLMREEDWERASAAIERELKRREAIEV